MQQQDFFVNLDSLQVEANDEILVARTEPHIYDDNVFKTRHFEIRYDTKGYITSLSTTLSMFMSGKLANYEDSCTIVDNLQGDVYTLEELFSAIFR